MVMRGGDGLHSTGLRQLSSCLTVAMGEQGVDDVDMGYYANQIWRHVNGQGLDKGMTRAQIRLASGMVGLTWVLRAFAAKRLISASA